MRRKLGRGILKRGFRICNSLYTVSIPSRTSVSFLYDTDTKTQEVTFGNFPVLLFREAFRGEHGRWIASVYGRQMTVHYDDPAPYPLSYFR